MALWLCGEAAPAEVTDMPPEMGVLGGLRYAGSSLAGGLLEGDARIAERRIARHDFTLGVAFSPIGGFALTLDLATTPSLRFRYPEARTMIVEPLTGAGSYLAGEPSPQTPEIRAGGVEGIWFGVALAPFSERYALGQRATWRLEAGLRTPSKQRNLWTAKDGSRGPSPGGTAFRLGGAFSSDLGPASPWLRARWTVENPVEIDVVDENGTVWARDLPLKPASHVQMSTGLEVVAVTLPDPALRFAVDGWVGAGYRGWEDIASGVVLPNVLDGSRSIPVTSGDTLTGELGLAADLHVLDVPGERPGTPGLLRIRLGTTLGGAVPYRLEHVYDVRTTPGTVGATFFLQVLGQGSFNPG